jgi:hypothetical protein
MPRVTSLDGKVYELDAETLEKYRIPDEQVAGLNNLEPLPPAPAVVAPKAATQEWVKIRQGPGNSTVIDVTLPAR